MTVMTRDPGTPAEFLLADFLTLDTPEGYRAELIDGEIVVTPPPDGNHQRDIWHILEQVIRDSSVKMQYSGQSGLIVPSRLVPGEGRLIPDAVFAPAELDVFHNAPSWMPPDGIELALEVTSSRPDLDRNGKRRAYAGAGIPLYLLVDRQDRRVILFSHPAHDDYSRTSAVPFGDKLDLPKPFDFALDTAAFAD
ncbi:MAG TPA: Uma2 family endonuclease [Trebonia sp.]